METLRSWALSVVSAAAVTAIISFVSPSGSTEKPVKFLTALFMLLCFTAPLVGAEFDYDISGEVRGISEWMSDSELEREIKNEVSDTLVNEIKSALGAYLEGEGISDFEIEVNVDIDEDNNIEIGSIGIVLSEEADTEKIKDFVESRFGITPAFSVKREGG